MDNETLVGLAGCPFCGAAPIEQDPYFSRISEPGKEQPDVACPNGHTMMMPRETWSARLNADSTPAGDRR